MLELPKDKLHRDGSIVNVEDRPSSWLSDYNSDNPCDIEKARRNWGFAFAHASRSSKSILVALRWLRITPDVYLGHDFVGTKWIVREMIEWLKVCAGTILIHGILTIGKEQTADSQPQDELVAWMESVCAEVERR